MEYQEIIKLLDNSSSQTSKFRTKIYLEINDTHVECTTPIAKLNLKLRC